MLAPLNLYFHKALNTYRFSIAAIEAILKDIFPYWPLIFVTVLLIVDLLYAQLGTLPVDGLTINYTLMSFYQASAFVIPLSALNGIVVFVFHFVSTKSWGNRSRNRANLIAIILFAVVAIPFSFQVTAAWWDQLQTSTFTPQAQVSFRNESYRLAFVLNVPNVQGWYNLYRCDSLGFSCPRVFIVSSDGLPRSDIHIETDSVSDALSIIVDGKRIATYTPEQTSPS